MMGGTVFYIQCKPWGTDPVDLIRRHNILFFGYPVFRGPETEYDRNHMSHSIVDPSGGQDDWDKWLNRSATWHPDMSERERSSYRVQANKNRKFVREVIKPGDIALLARPNRGVVYCTRIETFELVDSPPWADEFASLLDDQGRQKRYESEISQCWRVEPFTEIRIPHIPGWIRSSSFGRASYNRVVPPDGLDPFQAMTDVMRGIYAHRPAGWTQSVGEIGKLLVGNLSPASFEHLMVSLMQLENPSQTWLHVGGSGDGGVDGMGTLQDGSLAALLQCKFRLGSSKEIFSSAVVDTAPERIVASLLHPAAPKIPLGIRFIGRDEVAALVLKHSARLPEALTLHIGSSTSP